VLLGNRQYTDDCHTDEFKSIACGGLPAVSGAPCPTARLHRKAKAARGSCAWLAYGLLDVSLIGFSAAVAVPSARACHGIA